MKSNNPNFLKSLTSRLQTLRYHIQPLRAHRGLRASLFSPYYSSGRATLDGLIRAAFEIRKNHRTEATVGTEVAVTVDCPPFAVWRSEFAVRGSQFGVHR